MKISKVKICLLLFACVMIVSISTVSATDDVNVTSFNEMNTEIQAGNNVILNNDINGLDGIKEGILIKGNTTVDGNGHSINAQEQGRFFKVEKTGELTLKNIILKNGYADRGGAIYSATGHLIVINSTFNNNNAINRGGAIFANAGALTVRSSTFNNNNANNGGAIWTLGINVCFNCTFNKNTAKDKGGAIFLDGGRTYTICDCIFQKNKANNIGGAIYVYQGNAEIIIIHNQWINNSAKKGDNIYNTGFYDTIEYNYFVGCDNFMEYKVFSKNYCHKDSKRYYTLDEWNKHYDVIKSLVNDYEWITLPGNIHIPLKHKTIENNVENNIENNVENNVADPSMKVKKVFPAVIGKPTKSIMSNADNINVNTDNSAKEGVTVTNSLINFFNINSLTSLINGLNSIELDKSIMSAVNSLITWFKSLDAKVLGELSKN